MRIKYILVHINTVKWRLLTWLTCQERHLWKQVYGQSWVRVPLLPNITNNEIIFLLQKNIIVTMAPCMKWCQNWIKFESYLLRWYRLRQFLYYRVFMMYWYCSRFGLEWLRVRISIAPSQFSSVNIFPQLFRRDLSSMFSRYHGYVSISKLILFVI